MKLITVTIPIALLLLLTLVSFGMGMFFVATGEYDFQTIKVSELAELDPERSYYYDEVVRSINSANFISEFIKPLYYSAIGLVSLVCCFLLIIISKQWNFRFLEKEPVSLGVVTLVVGAYAGYRIGERGRD